MASEINLRGVPSYELQLAKLTRVAVAAATLAFSG